MDHTKIFQDGLEEIDSLVSTPYAMRELALSTLRKINLAPLHHFEKMKIKNSIQALANISDSSFKRSFTIIFNQVCVLSVSILNATLENFFVNYSISNWDKIKIKKDKKIKFTIQEIAEHKFKLRHIVGNLILAKDTSISFQDLQSTLRTFDDYFGKKIKIDNETKKNTIFYQQCRHILVHRNGIVDGDFLRKVGENNIKKYKLDDKIELDEKDWENIKKSFSKIVDLITK